MTRSAFALCLLVVLCAGCEPTLAATTAPPPSAIAALDDWDDRIEISHGVALAFECTFNGPCIDATASTDDPTIAEVRPAISDDLDPWGGQRGPQPRTMFVVCGKQAGRTTLHLRSDDGDRDLRVDVR